MTYRVDGFADLSSRVEDKFIANITRNMTPALTILAGLRFDEALLVVVAAMYFDLVVDVFFLQQLLHRVDETAR